MLPTLVRTAVPDLPVPDPELLAAAAAGEAGRARYDQLVAALPALSLIEARQPPAAPGDLPASLRVAAWNLERGRHPDETTAALRRERPDVVLLSEMDLGMARTGNRHTTRDLAERLGFGHLFGVEFVELGLGFGRELVDHAGESNAASLHGNAILSRLPFRSPFLIRLDAGGAWFDLDWHHRRLGGRVALGAVVETADGAIAVVSVHLENRSTPDERRDAMERLLAGLAETVPGVPVVVAGDLNCAEMPDPAREAGRDWFERPDGREPLFAAMRGAGFTWTEANTAEQTRRAIPDGRRAPWIQRIDWVFVRGLVAAEPRTLAAAAPDGTALSDHELLAVTLRRRIPAAGA